MAEVTIILICRDEVEMLRASLPAALGQRGVDAELVVVQNGASEEVSALLAAHPEARVLRLAEQVSYAAAYNTALAQPTAPAVLLLNADCFLEPGFCAAALEALAEGERVGAVQGKLLRAAGPRPEDRLEEIDSIGILMRRSHRNTIAGHGAPAEAYSTPGPVFGPDGAAALYRREMLDDVAPGGEVLDVSMESYATDADLAWRARLRGWRAIYAPGAVAYHVRTYSPSTRDRVPEATRRLQFRNRYLMMLKNDTAATLLPHLPWVAAFELGALGHALIRERSLLVGYAEAMRLAAGARARRRAARGRRASGGRGVRQALAGLAPLR